MVRHFAANDSVFFGDDYLIKGVAGRDPVEAVARVRATKAASSSRTASCALDKALGLPELADNLEAPPVLLERRLRERDAGIALEQTGRGRFRLRVKRTLSLVEGPS